MLFILQKKLRSGAGSSWILILKIGLPDLIKISKIDQKKPITKIVKASYGKSISALNFAIQFVRIDLLFDLSIFCKQKSCEHRSCVKFLQKDVNIAHFARNFSYFKHTWFPHSLALEELGVVAKQCESKMSTSSLGGLDTTGYPPFAATVIRCSLRAFEGPLDCEL